MAAAMTQGMMKMGRVMRLSRLNAGLLSAS
jgi:hypothetical protein